MRKVKFYLLLIFVFPFLISSNIKKNEKIEINLNIISIGINKYDYFIYENCVSDSQLLAKKIVTDSKEFKNIKFNKVNTYLLNDEKATKKDIVNAFKQIIKTSNTKDYFVFYFAGIAKKIDSKIHLIPFQNGAKESLNLVEIASYMEQIPASNQLIISDACFGSSFANELILNLFESNPIIAKNTNRQRTIITNNGKFDDVSKCDDINGPLLDYVLKSGNILNVFDKKLKKKFLFKLMMSEEDCPYFKDKEYVTVYEENVYKKYLINNHFNKSSRGTITKSNENTGTITSSKIPKTYAFIVATDKYKKNQSSWSDLKNPIKDADAVSNILETKYNVEVVKVYNKTGKETLLEFINFKNKIGKNDKLIFFVAGHGYFSEDFSDGFLVLNDSKSLQEDKIFESYLSMAKLNRLLNGVSCKQTFTIFDVCFGSSFDLNSKDVRLSNYSKINSDISIDEFIKRKEKYTSRIFLASGKAEVPDYWNNSLNHSPFASKLIDVLKNEKQFISPSKLYEALEANVTEPIMKSYGSHEERGDFILKVK